MINNKIIKQQVQIILMIIYLNQLLIKYYIKINNNKINNKNKKNKKKEYILY